MTALARTTDPATSHAAAASINRPRSHSIVLAVLSLTPMTDDDLVWLCRNEPISPSRARTARHELTLPQYGALVRDTGRTERLRSGRHAAVWEVVQERPA